MKTKQTTLTQKLGVQSPQNRLPRIRITEDVLNALKEEFDVTYQTINVSLRFFLNSKTSKTIRRRAQELMRETMVKNEQFLHEYDQD